MIKTYEQILREFKEYALQVILPTAYIRHFNNVRKHNKDTSPLGEVLRKLDNEGFKKAIRELQKQKRMPSEDQLTELASGIAEIKDSAMQEDLMQKYRQWIDEKSAK